MTAAEGFSFPPEVVRPHAGPPFAPAEYDRRLTLVRAAMDRAGLGALVVCDPSNMAWLTGYDGWSFYVPQAVVLPPDGLPVWWGRAQDAAGALRTVDPDRCAIAPYADNFVQSAERHAMENLGDLLHDLGLDGAAVGVEMDNYYYSARAHAVLAGRLDRTPLQDATGLVNRCRTVKSAPELAFMRHAAAISDKMIRLALDLAEPGLRKHDLAAALSAAGIAGTSEAWGDYPAIVPLLPSGPDAAAPHLTWDGRAMRRDEATFFELSGCHRRYHAPLCRTVFLGTPPDHILHAEEALVEGFEAGLNAARPGARACDVAEALGARLERAGIQRGARCGYPVGLSYPPDWGERTISFRAEDDTLLEAGMTFHFMPGLWMDDWGMEITETILIREDGPAEPFGTVPRRLFVKP